jgi:hypothetical protein
MRLWSNSSVPKSNGGFNPEKRLLAAVLQRAITDFLTGDGEVQLSAREWLFSDDDTSETFCFCYICEALDFHGSELRKAISRQYDRQVKEVASKTDSVAASASVTVSSVAVATNKSVMQAKSINSGNIPSGIPAAHEVPVRGAMLGSLSSAAA